MSLLRVHKVLIAIAILFCAGFAVRDIASGDAHAGTVWRVAASAIGAIVLGLYLRRLVRTKGGALDANTLRSKRRGDN